MFVRRPYDAGPVSLPRLGALAIGLVLSWALVAPVAAEESEEPPLLDRFSLFAEAAPHVVVQRVRGSVDSNFAFSSRKENYLTSMNFRFGGGIKGPAIEAIWGKPRPVIYAGALVPLNESSTIGTISRESNPGREKLVEESKYSVEYGVSGLAGVGMEFTIPVLDSEIAVMPSIESLHLVSRYVGKGTKLITSSIPGVPSEEHTLRTKEELVQHFLGPSVRVTTPTVVLRGVGIDFFVNASLLFDVAGTRRNAQVTGQNGDQGNFNFEAGTGVAQVSSGFQLRFP